MAYLVVWSPKALEDVETIATYVADDSISYAKAVVRKIFDATRNLSNFPYSGRIVPELSDDTVREKIAHSYRVIYKVEEETVTVLAVIHGKQLLGEI